MKKAIALAGLFALVGLVALFSLGSSTPALAAPPEGGEQPNAADPTGSPAEGHKITICHNGQLIEVDVHARFAHVETHGDDVRVGGVLGGADVAEPAGQGEGAQDDAEAACSDEQPPQGQPEAAQPPGEEQTEETQHHQGLQQDSTGVQQAEEDEPEEDAEQTDPRGDEPLVNENGARGGGHTPVEICHKGRRTITVDDNALEAHLGHGDTPPDACPALLDEGQPEEDQTEETHQQGLQGDATGAQRAEEDEPEENAEEPSESGGTETVETCDGESMELKPEEKRALELHNEIREQHSLDPLCVDAELTRAARSHSGDMIKKRYFSHTSLSGETLGARLERSGYEYRAAGENIAWGTGTHATPEDTMDRWMESPGHRENVLDGGFEEVGVGAATGDLGEADGHAATMYTVDFGTPRR
jgi:uncharacterized protein YkwD